MGRSTRRSSISVGLISDTHGLLRPEALAALQGSDFIIHAGDVGDPSVLDRLSTIAPVTAVRGNNDNDAWASGVRETEVLAVGAALIYIIHDVALLDVDPAEAGLHAVVAGHSHRPSIELRAGLVCQSGKRWPASFHVADFSRPSRHIGH
jgi:uncharacterized protein